MRRSLARQPNINHAQRSPRTDFQPLVRRSVSINGTTFSASVRDGASADEIIERVAREHGGGVAKVYNAEFKAYEIVAVKVGGNLIVKDDSEKVSKADFSHFKDSDSVRETAVRASSESKGGIHFFLGKSGIPVAVGNEGELAFPNAEELRLRGDANTIHISLVDYNANPVTLDDLDSMYSNTGGIRLSSLAQEQMARPHYLENGIDLTREEIKAAHGGMRNEKLLLVDTSVLVLNMDGGDMVTMAEHAETKGFMAARFDAVPPVVPPIINQPVQNHMVDTRSLRHTDLGPMHIPMDGSDMRIPYLFVKVFDGNVGDAVSITHPLEALKTSKDKTHQKKHIQLPAVLLRNTDAGVTKDRKDILQTEPEFTLRPVKTKETTPEKFRMPLTERPLPEIATLKKSSHTPAIKPKTVRKFLKHLPAMKTLPLKKKKKARKLRPRPSAIKKKKSKNVPKADLIKTKKKKAKPRRPVRATEPIAESIAKKKKPSRKRPKPNTMKKQRAAILKHEKTRKKKADRIRKAKAASQSRKKKRKKRIKPYFLNEMLGLYKKRTKAGRARVRNSR